MCSVIWLSTAGLSDVLVPIFFLPEYMSLSYLIKKLLLESSGELESTSLDVSIASQTCPFIPRYKCAEGFGLSTMCRGTSTLEY